MKKNNVSIAAMVLASVLAASLNAAASDRKEGQQVVNINTATATELSYLPGVGESKAHAIIKYRTKHPFKKVEEMMRVKGIGRKRLKKMIPYISVKGATTAKAKIKISQ